jgi:hypothetical protein
MKRMQNIGLTLAIGALVFAGCSSSSGTTRSTSGSTATDGNDGSTAIADVVGGDSQSTDGADGADGVAATSATDGADGTSGIDGIDGGTADVIISAPDTATEELSCTGILQCVNANCASATDPTTFGACLTDCQNKGSAQSSLAFQNFFQCIGQFCSQVSEAEYSACLQTNCNDQYTACIIGEGGDLDCGGLLTCLNACSTAADAAACQSECIGDVQSAEVLDTYTAIEECVFAECPAPEGGTPDPACISAAQQEGGACADELQACIIGEGGTLDCAGIFQCFTGCTTLECAQDCQGQAQDGAALGSFQDILTCAAAACPEGSPETCFTGALSPGGACSAEIDACLGSMGPTDGADGMDNMDGTDGETTGGDGSAMPAFALPMQSFAIPAHGFSSRLPSFPRR